MTNVPMGKTEQELQKKIDVIFDKYTKMLTKTTQPDGQEIVSFDVVVQDIFETKKEILTLISHERAEAVDEFAIFVDAKTTSDTKDKLNIEWIKDFKEYLNQDTERGKHE